MTRVLLLLTIFLPAPFAFAATYFVATNGSNRNPGTSDKPLATIAFAVSKLTAPGDKLIVRGGTYRESVTVWQKRGSSGKPIAIYAQQGEKPVIDGRGSRTNGVVMIVDSSFVDFEGFEVRNGPHSGIIVLNSQHVDVRWNSVHECQNNGIGATSDRRFGTSDVVIEGNEVTRCVLSNRARTARHGWAQALSAFSCTHVTIAKNYVHDNFGEGIDYIVSDFGTIRGNRLWDNFSVNIYLDNATNTIVDGNFVTSGWSPNAKQFLRSGSPVGGIAAANERYEPQNPLHDNIVINNVVVGTSSGFAYRNNEFGGGLHHALIANNTFVRTTRGILSIDPAKHEDVTIANNIFEQSDDAPPPDAQRDGITFRSNAWHGGRGAIAGPGDVNAEPHFVKVRTGTAEDFRVEPASPLRGAATPLPNVTTDYTGTARRSRTIGAFD